MTDAALLAKAQRRPGGRAREELVERHLPLVRGLARRYSAGPTPFEDLVQIGSVGLLKAIDGFDASRGTDFRAYAFAMVVGELKRYFRDHSWTIRVSRRTQELHVSLARIVDELTGETGRSPTIAEIAAHAGVSEEDVLVALEAGLARRPFSFSSPTVSTDEGTADVAEFIGNDDPGYELSELRDQLRDGLAHLDDRERVIIRLRFFEGMTQSEIATRIGCSQMQISRLLRSTLEKLADRLDPANSADVETARRGR